MYTITEIENAIVTALDADPINTYAKTIESYDGQLEQEIGKTLLILPAVLPVFAGDRFTEASGSNTVYNRICDWDVLVAFRNLRGESATRRGVSGASEIGIYEALDDVRSKLVGENLGLEIEPFRILWRRRILASARAFIYSVRIQTQMDYEKS